MPSRPQSASAVSTGSRVTAAAVRRAPSRRRTARTSAVTAPMTRNAIGTGLSGPARPARARPVPPATAASPGVATASAANPQTAVVMRSGVVLRGELATQAHQAAGRGNWREQQLPGVRDHDQPGRADQQRHSCTRPQQHLAAADRQDGGAQQRVLVAQRLVVGEHRVEQGRRPREQADGDGSALGQPDAHGEGVTEVSRREGEHAREHQAGHRHLDEQPADGCRVQTGSDHRPHRGEGGVPPARVLAHRRTTGCPGPTRSPRGRRAEGGRR